MRSRGCPQLLYPRSHCTGPQQHVALSGPAARTRRLRSGHSRRLDASASRPAAGRAYRRQQSLRQERRSLSAHAELQGSRGLGRVGQRADLRLRHGRLLVDRQPSERGRRSGRAAGAQELHPRSRRLGAREDSQHPGLRCETCPHRRQLRPRQPPLLADRRPLPLGIRQRKPASLLR